MENQIMQKQIQIVDLKPVFISQLGKNKYVIKGNDGIQYECWNADWFQMRKLGEFLTISYSVRQNTGSNGKVYTNYSIEFPKGATPEIVRQMVPAANPTQTETNPAIKQILDRINIMETNVIDAIRMHCGHDIKIEEEDVPNQIPIVEENENGSYSNHPF